MASYRQTKYDPLNPQILRENNPNLDYGSMEKNLAEAIRGLKMEDSRKKRELEKVAMESEEIKELKAKIKAAALNKERSMQI